MIHLMDDMEQILASTLSGCFNTDTIYIVDLIFLFYRMYLIEFSSFTFYFLYALNFLLFIIVFAAALFFKILLIAKFVDCA